MTAKDSVSFLELTLHGHRVGFIAGYRSGKNVLIFAPEFKENSRRPTLSLTTHPGFPNAEKKYAFAIRRFDRQGEKRMHTEDFAQVMVKYPHEKYDSASYEQIGKVLYNFTGNGLANVQQFARRLLLLVCATIKAERLNDGLFFAKPWPKLQKRWYTHQEI